jgi:hypothetical protein
MVTNQTKERQVENHLKKVVEASGGIAIKLSPIGYVGIPDRLVLLPGGVLIFVEVKRPKGGVVAPLQVWWANKLKKLGFRHEFALTQDDVDRIIGGRDGQEIS